MLRYPNLNLSLYGDGIDNYKTGKKTRSIRRGSVPNCDCNVFRTVSPSDRSSLNILIVAYSKVNDVPPQTFARSRHMCSENYALLGYYAGSSGNSLSTSRDSSSGNFLPTFLVR